MTQNRVHHGCGLVVADDGCVRNTRWNANPGSVVLLQADDLKLTIPEKDQIQAAAQDHELIGLMAMAEQFSVWCCFHVRDQCFMAGNGITEEGDS